MSLADPDVTAVAAETVVLATRNAAKLHELDRILAAEQPGGAQIRLAGLDEFPGAPDVPETRATFAACSGRRAAAADSATTRSSCRTGSSRPPPR